MQQRRALETALLAGRRLSDVLTHDAAHTPTRSRQARYLVVDPGAVLASRIADRVQAMVQAGWVDEIRRLMEAVPDEAPAWNASGYRTLREAVASRDALESAMTRVIIETRQYAKRQRTWCRHQLPAAHVLTLDSSAPDALARADAWWESEDGSGA